MERGWTSRPLKEGFPSSSRPMVVPPAGAAQCVRETAPGAQSQGRETGECGNRPCFPEGIHSLPAQVLRFSTRLSTQLNLTCPACRPALLFAQAKTLEHLEQNVVSACGANLHPAAARQILT